MSERPLPIREVNALDEAAFVALFGAVFESTPSLAATTWARRPFADRAALVTAFQSSAGGLDEADRLALLRAHPQLAAAGPMTAASADEQRSAGLTDLDPDLRARLVDANAAYLSRFGFPFIIAVRGRGPAEVAAALTERLEHDEPTERAAALAEVQRIAELRIERLVQQ